MSEYRLLETEQFARDLTQLARSGQPKLVEKLRSIAYPQLREHPHFGPHIRKLKGYSPATWRYRIGSWRFFYEIDDGERLVSLLAASHRGSAY